MPVDSAGEKTKFHRIRNIKEAEIVSIEWQILLTAKVIRMFL